MANQLATRAKQFVLWHSDRHDSAPCTCHQSVVWPPLLLDHHLLQHRSSQAEELPEPVEMPSKTEDDKDDDQFRDEQPGPCCYSWGKGVSSVFFPPPNLCGEAPGKNRRCCWWIWHHMDGHWSRQLVSLEVVVLFYTWRLQFWHSSLIPSSGRQWVELPSQNYAKFPSEKVEDVEFSCIDIVFF